MTFPKLQTVERSTVRENTNKHFYNDRRFIYRFTVCRWKWFVFGLANVDGREIKNTNTTEHNLFSLLFSFKRPKDLVQMHKQYSAVFTQIEQHEVKLVSYQGENKVLSLNLLYSQTGLSQMSFTEWCLKSSMTDTRQHIFSQHAKVFMLSTDAHILLIIYKCICSLKVSVLNILPRELFYRFTAWSNKCFDFLDMREILQACLLTSRLHKKWKLISIFSFSLIVNW